jgi:fumarate reductase subunit D
VSETALLLFFGWAFWVCWALPVILVLLGLCVGMGLVCNDSQCKDALGPLFIIIGKSGEQTSAR